MKDCRTAFNRDMTILLTMQFAARKIYELTPFNHPTVGLFYSAFESDLIVGKCWGVVCDANCLPPLESNFECMKFHATEV